MQPRLLQTRQKRCRKHSVNYQKVRTQYSFCLYINLYTKPSLVRTSILINVSTVVLNTLTLKLSSTFFFSKLKRTVYRTFCISALVYALYILQDRVVCLEERKSVTLIFIQDPSAIFQRPLLLGSLRNPRLIGLVTIQVICTFPKMMN